MRLSRLTLILSQVKVYANITLRGESQDYWLANNSDNIVLASILLLHSSIYQHSSSFFIYFLLLRLLLCIFLLLFIILLLLFFIVLHALLMMMMMMIRQQSLLFSFSFCMDALHRSGKLAIADWTFRKKDTLQLSCAYRKASSHINSLYRRKETAGGFW